MIYSVVINGYTNGKRTHRQVVTTEADSREDVAFNLHHFLDRSGVPPGVEVRPDWRTLKQARDATPTPETGATP